MNDDKISLRWRRTKIIATIGPSTDTAKGIDDLIRAGVNVFRLNMSHGNHAYHRKVFARIRNCSKKADTFVAILMDLCGPKIRVGHFENGSIILKRNESVIVTCR
ncbi:MAG: pyruvate kinase, partial [Gammaproteobacteria bacterium]|nr:pyruvate kinase [Gammaproteobacteria bacterium]